MKIDLPIADAELRYEALSAAATRLRTMHEVLKLSHGVDYGDLLRISAALKIMATEVDQVMRAKAETILQQLAREIASGQNDMFTAG